MSDGKGLQFNSDFNTLRDNVSKYIIDLEKKCNEKDSIIADLRNKVVLLSNQLEQYKKSNSNLLIEINSIKELNNKLKTMIPIKNNAEDKYVKFIKEIKDKSQVLKEISLIKVKMKDCPQCETKLGFKEAYIMCYRDNKCKEQVGCIIYELLYCSKCKRYFFNQNIMDKLKSEVSPYFIKLVSYVPQKTITHLPSAMDLIKSMRDKRALPSVQVYTGQQDEKSSISNDSYFNEESELHKLGYQITGTTREQRWNVLRNTAIPKLGFNEVIRQIRANINLRLKQTNGEYKFRNAIREWEYDIEQITKFYRRW